MRALIIFSLLLLSHATWAQTTPPATKATPKPSTAPTSPKAPPGASATSPAEPTPIDIPPPPPQPNAEIIPAVNTEPPPAVDLNPPLEKGFVVSPSFTYFSRKLQEDAGLVGEISSFIFDAKGGYLFDFGLFVGAQAIYDMGKSNNNDVNSFYFGPTLGYNWDYTGLVFSATYHLLGEADFGNPGKYDKVTGVQVDVGYPLTLTKTIKFGPQLSWKNLELKDSNTLADDKLKGVSPYATFWFNF